MAQDEEVDLQTPNAERPTSNAEDAATVASGPSTINNGQSGSGQPLTCWWWRALDLIIGGLFIFAGLTKIIDFEHLMADLGHFGLADLPHFIADPNRFALDIESYKIVPWTIAVRLALFLPWLEIVTGLALATRKLYLGALAILTALMAIFIVATISVKIRGLDVTCGCFGYLSSKLGFAGHLILDFAILGGLIALFFATRRNLWPKKS